MSEYNNKDIEDNTTDSPERVYVLKPEDIAEKLGVKATIIGVYARNFSDILDGHVEYTEGKHRRFSTTGFKLLHDIHHLIKVDKMTYAQAKEEMLRRVNKEGSLKSELAPYEVAKQLSQMSEMEKQFYNSVLAMQEEIKRQREQMSQFIEIQKVERELTNRKIEEMGNIISGLNERIDKSADWAKVTLDMLEMKGKPGFFSKLFGIRNEVEEKRISEYCRKIIENDRQAKDSIKKIKTADKPLIGEIVD